MGAVVASAAADSGHEVTVCVRTPLSSLSILRGGEWSPVRASIVSSPGALAGPGGVVADIVFVTVKATDTASAAGWLSVLCGPSTLTVAVQNGLDHTARLAPFLPGGAPPAIPALAYIAAERLEPGRIRQIQGNLLVVPSAFSSQVDVALSGGIEVRGTDDMLTASWLKLLGNLVANPITTLTMRRLDVMEAPGIAELARGVLGEAVAVGRAEGARLSDADVDQMVEGASRYGTDTGSSMLYDRLAGRPLEHDYLIGEVVRRAADHGIPVPLNSALLALLDALDQGQRRGPIPGPSPGPGPGPRPRPGPG